MRIEQESLVKAMEQAKLAGEGEVLNELIDLFTETDKFDEDGYVEVESPLIVNYMNKQQELGLNDLALAFSCATYECNHDIKKKAHKYFSMLLEQEILDEDTKIIMDMVKHDKELNSYIEKCRDVKNFKVKVKTKEIEEKFPNTKL